MKRIQLDQDIRQFLVSKAQDIGEAPSEILRRELHLAPPADSVAVDDDVYAFLVSRMTSLNESASTILRRELHLTGDDAPSPNVPANPPVVPPVIPPVTPPVVPPAGPTVVSFHILPDTAGQSWNARADAVVANVGDTLRIFNDDGVAHRLHTPGVPFAHPQNDIPPGQSADFFLKTPFSPAGNGPLTDHDFGFTAQFWIEVRAV